MFLFRLRIDDRDVSKLARMQKRFGTLDPTFHSGHSIRQSTTYLSRSACGDSQAHELEICLALEDAISPQQFARLQHELNDTVGVEVEDATASGRPFSSANVKAETIIL